MIRELGQPFAPGRNELGLRDEPISIAVERVEDLLEYLLCFTLVVGVVSALFARCFVMYAIDRFELPAVKYSVPIEVVQLEEGLCERGDASSWASTMAGMACKAHRGRTCWTHRSIARPSACNTDLVS